MSGTDTQSHRRCEHMKLPFSVLNENPLDSLTLPKLLEIPERIFDEQRQSFYKSIPRSNTGTGSRKAILISDSPTELFSFSKDGDGDVEMMTDEELSRKRETGGSMDDIPSDQLNTK